MSSILSISLEQKKVPWQAHGIVLDIWSFSLHKGLKWVLEQQVLCHEQFTCKLKSFPTILVLRSFSLIKCNWATASLIFILSLGDSIVQDTPIPNIKIKHSRILGLPIWFWMWVSFVLVSISSLSQRIIESTMLITRSGKAPLTKSWRFKLSLKMLTVGLFLVNISNNSMP